MMLISYAIYNDWTCLLFSVLLILLFTPITSPFSITQIIEIHTEPIENAIIITSLPSLY